MLYSNEFCLNVPTPAPTPQPTINAKSLHGTQINLLDQKGIGNLYGTQTNLLDQKGIGNLYSTQ